MTYAKRAQESIRRGGDQAARMGLYRDTERGVIAGVCAGMARYFNVDLKIVRILTVLGMIFFAWPFLIAYIVAAVVLNTAPAGHGPAPHRHADAAGTDDPSPDPMPPATVDELTGEYDALEGRLRGLEAYLSSKRFELDREFRNLEQA